MEGHTWPDAKAPTGGGDCGGPDIADMGTLVKECSRDVGREWHMSTCVGAYEEDLDVRIVEVAGELVEVEAELGNDAAMMVSSELGLG
jgi:hypothetical protein